MTNAYTLDSLKAELEKRYAPVEIQVGNTKVTLRNLLRLDKEKRTEVMAAIEKSNAADSSTAEGFDAMLDNLISVLRAVADKPDVLEKGIGSDLGLAMYLVELWTGATQPGEVSNSPA